MSITESATWTLGSRLRSARAGAGLTQEQLADLLHVHRNSLRQYEANKQVLNPWLVRAWALICEVDEDWLLHGRPGTSPHPPTDGERDDGGTTHGEWSVAWLTLPELVAA